MRDVGDLISTPDLFYFVPSVLFCGRIHPPPVVLAGWRDGNILLSNYRSWPEVH